MGKKECFSLLTKQTTTSAIYSCGWEGGILRKEQAGSAGSGRDSLPRPDPSPYTTEKKGLVSIGSIL